MNRELRTENREPQRLSLRGEQTYGFLPIRLPDDFSFAQVIHAANERIPVDAVDFGAHAIFQAIQRVGM